jgi:hypothetical protein
MIGQLGRGKPFAAQCPMGNGAIRITGNLCDFAVFDIHDDSAPSVAHAAVALDRRVVAVYFHLSFYIRISKLAHLRLPMILLRDLKNYDSLF